MRSGYHATHESPRYSSVSSVPNDPGNVAYYRDTSLSRQRHLLFLGRCRARRDLPRFSFSFASPSVLCDCRTTSRIEMRLTRTCRNNNGLQYIFTKSCKRATGVSLPKYANVSRFVACQRCNRRECCYVSFRRRPQRSNRARNTATPTNPRYPHRIGSWPQRRAAVLERAAREILRESWCLMTTARCERTRRSG